MPETEIWLLNLKKKKKKLHYGKQVNTVAQQFDSMLGYTNLLYFSESKNYLANESLFSNDSVITLSYPNSLFYYNS